MKTSHIKINPADNVAVALENLSRGQALVCGDLNLALTEDIPAGHKFALQDFARDEVVVKYGYPIGHATQAIAKGAWVSEKNIGTNLNGLVNYAYEPHFEAVQFENKNHTFKGYQRADGRVGIRNELWVIPTVGCVNGIANKLAEQMRMETQGMGVDAIVAFPHNYGCSQLGEDHENTRMILRDMVLHPNAGGVLVVGLGCENNQVSGFRELLGQIDPNRIKFMETQKVRDELDEGMLLLRELHRVASEDVRTDCPLSRLKVGLKCGGSDGFSGITANPMLGVFSDFMVAQAGTTVLTEVPEMFGAETILMNRCADLDTFEKTVRLINDFKGFFMQNNQTIYENPSPGNKAGGISTLEEKSLGCIQKGGTSAVSDVLSYGACLHQSGLNLLSAPGNDLVASTALAAAGCQLVLFSTGRGTPFGTFVPTLKIATNNELADNKPGWIDFNAGTLLVGESMEELSARFVKYVLQVAGGLLVNNEKKGYREIAIFKSGVTL